MGFDMKFYDSVVERLSPVRDTCHWQLLCEVAAYFASSGSMSVAQFDDMVAAIVLQEERTNNSDSGTAQEVQS